MTTSTYPQIITICLNGEEIADYCERCSAQLNPTTDDERYCSPCLHVELEEEDFEDDDSRDEDAWRGV